MIYKLNKKYLKHVCSEQKASMLNTFTGCKQDRDFIYIDYVDKNYLCMPMLEKIRDSKTCALSLFSGCGGLDIGTQMAGVKIITTVDFEPATVETLNANPFFFFF